MENNLKYIVYCTTNLINNKIYIGVHKTNPEKFDGYIGNGIHINTPSSYEYSKTRFQYAVKKYGPKNFKRNTIAIFNNEEDAYALEGEIVNKEFLQRKDVYNLALGGVFGAQYSNQKEVFQYDLQGNFVKKYSSYTEAALAVSRALISIQRAIKYKNRCANYYWTTTYFDKLDLSKMNEAKELETIPVFQYNNKGVYECCYNSIRDAARVLNKSHSNIANAIKLGTLCYNKYFTSVYSNTYAGAKSESIKGHVLYQYSLKGEFITEYKNMAEAKKATGIKSDIYKAVKLGRTAGGYQWHFEKLDYMPEVVPKSGRARKVGKYDLNGNLIQEYSSKSKAEKENGRGLAHVLEGRDKTHKGFVYKYLD